MLAAYFGLLLMVQERRSRAMFFGGAAVAIVIATFSFALALGGESIAERTFTLFAQDPLALYAGSRGGQLSYTFGELLQKYPLGAGLGRWGMIAVYFGSSGAVRRRTAVGRDSGCRMGHRRRHCAPGALVGALVVTLVTDARVARTHPDRACAGVRGRCAGRRTSERRR